MIKRNIKKSIGMALLIIATLSLAACTNNETITEAPEDDYAFSQEESGDGSGEMQVIMGDDGSTTILELDDDGNFIDEDGNIVELDEEGNIIE